MWDIDNFLKEDSFHATSTLVGLLLIFWESPKEKFEILLKDFELLMVEEAKLVVDCPTVVDEPENYGPTLQCTGHQIVGCFSSSSFQLLWTKYWKVYWVLWHNMIQSWWYLFDDDDDWVLRMKGAGTAWPVITASSPANTSHCTEQHSALHTALGT